MRISSTRGKSIIKNIVIGILWILIWHWAHLIVGRELYLPSPFAVFETLYLLLVDKSFWQTVYHSLYRVIIGFSLSVFLGVGFGVASHFSSLFRDFIRPLMTAIKSTPVLSFIIIALIWFKSTNVPIFICFLMCFPVVWQNVYTGFSNVDKQLLEMARIYKVKKQRIAYRIYYPAVLPFFVASCVTALGLGWKVSVAAEVLSHPRWAIGSRLHSAKAYLDSRELFAWTLVVIILSLVFEVGLNRLVKKLLPRGGKV